jgi:hypothetical protein
VLFLLGLFLLGPLSAEALQGASPHLAPQPSPLPALHAELEGLEGEAFRARMAELESAADPRPALDALILRAGRPTPPGLTGARARGREARRDEALAWMAGHDAWRTRARDLAAQEDGDEDLRCAALVSLGYGVQLRLVPDLAWVLGDDHSTPRERESARAALLQLTGRSFRTREEVEQASATWSSRTRDQIFAQEFLGLERERAALLEELLGHDPRRIAGAFSEGPPALRAAAARAVARSVGQQSRTLDGALGLLFERVDLEYDPLALHATLSALVGLIEALPPEAAPVERLRGILMGERFEGRPALTSSVATALARMPWADGSAGGAGRSYADGAARVAALVADLASERRPVDYESVSLGLDALRALLERASASVSGRGPARLAAAPARRVVLDLLRRRTVPTQVRLEAARSAGWVLTSASLDDLLAVLGAPGEPDRLRLELLTSVTHLAIGLDPAGEPARRMVASLDGLLSAPSLDLRLRAVMWLSVPELAGLRARAGQLGLPMTLVVRLGVEQNAGLRDSLLAALGGFGPDGALARALIALPTFDALLDDNHRRSDRMGACLRALCVGDGTVALEAARRLARDERPAPPPGASARGDRLRAALSVAVVASSEAAAAWPAADHGLLLAWSLELLDVGSAPGLEVLQRLADVHLDHAAGLEAFGAARVLAALDLARVSAGQGGIGDQVRGAFAEAQTRAGEDVSAVRLARARWNLAGGRAEASLVDWNELLFPGGAQDPAPGLAPADLRLARGAYGGSPAQAARVGLALVGDPRWSGQAPGVRLSDLLALADAAQASGEASLRAQALALLSGLPEPTPDGALPELAATSAPWSGTIQEVSDLDALRRRAATLAAPAAADDGESKTPPVESTGDGTAPISSKDSGGA